MVGNKSAGDIMERLKFLIDNGIQVNTQIVLCPEVNDGAILERSIEDLMSLWPGVESMAIVPAWPDQMAAARTRFAHRALA